MFPGTDITSGNPAFINWFVRFTRVTFVGAKIMKFYLFFILHFAEIDNLDVGYYDNDFIMLNTLSIYKYGIFTSFFIVNFAELNYLDIGYYDNDFLMLNTLSHK